MYLLTQTTNDTQLKSFYHTLKNMQYTVVNEKAVKHSKKMRNTRVASLSQIVTDGAAMRLAERRPSFVYTFDPDDCYLSGKLVTFIYQKTTLMFLTACMIIRSMA